MDGLGIVYIEFLITGPGGILIVEVLKVFHTVICQNRLSCCPKIQIIMKKFGKRAHQDTTYRDQSANLNKLALPGFCSHG